MTDFLEAFEGHNSETFSDFEKAMEDTVVIAASREASRRANEINESGVIPDKDVLQRHILELDQMIFHVINTGVTVAGRVQRCIEGDDSDFVMVSEVAGQFDGFIDSIRDGKLSFDYLVAVPILDDTGEIFTNETINEIAESGENADYSIQRIQAIPGEIILQFDMMHPIQAHAILQTTYPDTLRDIDNRIIHFADNKDELAIMGLRGFSVKTNSDELKHDNNEYVKAISCYVGGMVTVDRRVPYLVDIDGGYIEMGRGAQTAFQYKKVDGKLMTVGEFGLYTFPKTADEVASDISFGFTAVLHSDNADIPSPDVLLPIESLKSIQSLRRPASDDELLDDEDAL